LVTTKTSLPNFVRYLQKEYALIDPPTISGGKQSKINSIFILSPYRLCFLYTRKPIYRYCIWLEICYFKGHITTDSVVKNWYFKTLGVPHIGTRIRGSTVFRLLTLKKGSKILEIGAGNGTFSLEMEKKGYEVVGCDSLLGISREDVINLGKKVFEKTGFDFRFVQANGVALPFKNESFDGVLCADVLEHIPDEGSALKEIRRIIKKDGILILQHQQRVFTKANLRAFSERCTKTIPCDVEYMGRKTSLSERMMKEKGHLREYSLDKWKELCDKFNFELEDHEWQYKFFGAFFVELSHTFKLFGTMKWYQGIIFLLFYPLTKIDNLLPMKGTGIAIRARKMGHTI